MIDFLTGAASGCVVCAFGMWAFLKGQRSMLQIQSGGLPESLKKNKKAFADDESADLGRQLKNLFAPERNEG